MANPSLQIGNDNWAIKEDNLLGYSTAGTRFVPQPITMTRASAGTRVNSSGLVETVELLGSEEVTNGDFATDLSGWTTSGTNATNTITWETNGARIISTGTNIGLFQNTLIVGKTYRLTCDVAITVGKIGLDGATSGSTVNMVEGFNEIIFTAISTTFKIKRITGNDNCLLDNVSVKEATKNNLARVDYDGTASSLLAEPQRTNLIPYSEDFSQSDWTKQSNTTPTYNTTETLSPDGTYNATKLVGNGTDGIYKASISITGVAARSVYLKSVTGTVNVKLKDPNATITTLTLDVTNEWQRFDLTEDNGSSGQGMWVDDIPASGIYMWGAQIEEDYPTSYIPTDGSTVTRVQDQYEKTGISNLINSEEGVLFAELKTLANDSTNGRISLSDGTTANRMLLYSAANSIKFYVGVSGQSALAFTVTGVITEFNKVAISFKENDMKFYLNGVLVYSNTSAATFLANSLNTLQLADGNGQLNFFGKVKQLQVYKTALTDTELATLTTI